MEKSMSFYFFVIYLIISTSGRSIDTYNNETQYQCFTDDSCSQYDNIKLYNQKVFCCRPSHTLIFKLVIDDTVMESFALQTRDGLEKVDENEAHKGKTEVPQQGRTESLHQSKLVTPHRDKINEADSVTYSVVEVPNEQVDEDHKSLSPSTDEHFPTTLYFDLKKDPQGRLVKRHLNMRQGNSKVIRKMPDETIVQGSARVTYSVVEVPNEQVDEDHKSLSPSTDEHFTLYFDLKKDAQGRLVKRHLNMGQGNTKVIRKMPDETIVQGSARVSNMRPQQTEAPRSKAVTMCVCDKIEPRGFMEFLFNFLQSLCQDSWI